MDLKFTPDIQALANITMHDKPPPGIRHWPGIPWKCTRHGKNYIYTQRITGELFRAMRINVSVATPVQLGPVVKEPTIAISCQHAGTATGRLSGVKGTLRFRPGECYISLLLPGSHHDSVIELGAGQYEATVILIEKKYEAAFLELFPTLAAEMEQIRNRRSGGIPYPPQPLTTPINKLLQQITHYEGPPDSLHFTVSLSGAALILALHQQQMEPLTASADAYRVHSYLTTKLAEPLTAGKVAMALSMTRKRLNEVLKQCFRKTFKEYRTQLRMEVARELLSATNEQIDSIAQDLGYKSIAHFSNAFLKSEGMRPSEYRRSTR